MAAWQTSKYGNCYHPHTSSVVTSPFKFQFQWLVLQCTLYSVIQFYLRFPQLFGTWRVPLRGFQFQHKHLGPDALPDVTNGLWWASNPGPRWSQSSSSPLGHSCSCVSMHTTKWKVLLLKTDFLCRLIFQKSPRKFLFQPPHLLIFSARSHPRQLLEEML